MCASNKNLKFETAIKDLKVEFSKAVTELEFIEAMLDSEIIRKYEIEHKAPINPSKALNKITRLKNELESLKNDFKCEINHDLYQQLCINKELLEKLQQKAGISNNIDG
ncbi:22445_t:CDS:2 [Entrophospora sp. SA101]|nr:7800_t:CDS:2 [Entrophospora sp. SA101]CAJ0630198.1 12824_t:CDS:2 [Entrophospora sp. SA101]CAJ0768160.1 22445_t:CDS:2 [Entrophospora sp. SA101]CAJ0847495.1 6966_t:CDS:2 [Entrophospora sp. SA101]CAJ0872988.1 11664_t:CDS:2 [Entrophospora sp. SA101]